MTNDEHVALESLTERVNKLYNQIFTAHQLADSIRKVCICIQMM